MEGTQRTLADEMREYMEENALNITEAAKKIGYSRPALSSYLSGNYKGDSAEVEERLSKFLEAVTGVPRAVRISGTRKVLQSQGFYKNADSAKVLYVCSSAQTDNGLGMIVGRSGFGKTYALRLYSARDKVAYVECNPSMGCRDLLDAIEDALNIPLQAGSICRRMKGVEAFFNQNPGWLLVIDEADKLISKNSINKLEILRGLFDKCSNCMGLVVAGELTLENMVSSLDKRFHNRVDFYAKLTGLSLKEAEEYLSKHPMDEEAMEKLKEIATSKSENACFRKLDRIIRNCFRVTAEQGQDVITLKVVKEALKRTGW